MAELQAEDPAAAAQVVAKLGAAENPDPDSGDPAVRLAFLIRQIRSAMAAGQFDRARDLLRSVSDMPARGQLKSLIDFSEAASAIEQRSDQAASMANQLRPGIKRALLYIAMIANAPRLDLALQVLPLAAKDITLLPAEQRVRLLSALAAALLHTDLDSSLAVLNQVVEACNDVRVNPRNSTRPARAHVQFEQRDGQRRDSGRESRLLQSRQTERGGRISVACPRRRRILSRCVPDGGRRRRSDRLGAIILGARREYAAGAWVKLAESAKTAGR